MLHRRTTYLFVEAAPVVECTALSLLPPLDGPEQVHRKWHEADIRAGPAGMLKRSTPVSAGCAPCKLAKLIARRIGSPPDDRQGAGDRRRVPAPLAIEPEPRRGAVQVAERRGSARGTS